MNMKQFNQYYAKKSRMNQEQLRRGNSGVSASYATAGYARHDGRHTEMSEHERRRSANNSSAESSGYP